ncbi:MAG: phytoene/squalene synthase family protein [Opitutales bacterium]
MPPESNPAALFRAKSRTFSLAAQLFSREDQEAVARLYYFCRVLDDLADASAQGETAALERVISELDPAVSATDPVVLDFLDLAAKRGLSLEAATLLAQALRDDCGTRRVEDENELLAFAFGVAGTVGVLMCPVLGVHDPRAIPFAVDLGIALQLTNIARDVPEDAELGRYYLPRAWIEPAVIDAAIAGDSDSIETVDAAIERLLSLAESFYDSALAGFWFIGARNRRAVLLATMLYREIGQSLLRLGGGTWRKRRTLSAGEKIKLCLRTLCFAPPTQAKQWTDPSPPAHCMELRQKLEAAGVNTSSLETP